jgi:Cu(I)/Ag(I) efflux system membrane fusion protein
MAEFYSPELLAAQEELLQARDGVRNARGDAAEASAQATLDAVHERLSLWGLSDDQIRAIEERGTAEPRTTIAAPAGGTVVEKNAAVGMYVETGMELYTIADLSTVWIALDAYESDLAWVRAGQHAMFTVEGYPGETFHGEVSFVEPTVDPDTRTVKVRVAAPNPDGRLKPEMFVRATVLARQDGGRAALVVPASAPLLTGKRAVVYVEVPGAELPTYEGRDVVLGPRAGNYYVVVSGLREGERVVTEGNFKIDSALQIRAKESMMNPEGGPVGAVGHEGHGAGATDAGRRDETGGAPTGHQGH